MAKIGKQEAAAVANQVYRLMLERIDQLDNAYLKFGDESFKLAFSSEFKPVKKGVGLEVRTDMSFSPEPKVKDSTTTVVDGQQLLFQDDALNAKPAPRTPHRLDPRFLIDMTSRPHCEKGRGPWCTLKAPCWHCEGRDHADALTFNERHEQEKQTAKLRVLTKPIEKKELPEGARRAATV